MVRGYHVIFGCYGFWLPNDPRGSWLDFVRSYELYRHGEATKVNTKRSLANRTHDETARLAAKASLQQQPMTLTGEMARAVARAFAEVCDSSKLEVYGCAIMPDHVHLVVKRHSYAVEQVVRRLKQAATARLRDRGFVDAKRTVWVRSCWTVYLNTDDDFRRCISYVEDNPVKAGLKAQRWSFVKQFDV